MCSEPFLQTPQWSNTAGSWRGMIFQPLQVCPPLKTKAMWLSGTATTATRCFLYFLFFPLSCLCAAWAKSWNLCHKMVMTKGNCTRDWRLLSARQLLYEHHHHWMMHKQLTRQKKIFKSKQQVQQFFKSWNNITSSAQIEYCTTPTQAKTLPVIFNARGLNFTEQSERNFPTEETPSCNFHSLDAVFWRQLSAHTILLTGFNT